MHGCKSQWSKAALAIVAAWGACGVATAQQYGATLPPSTPVYSTPGYPVGQNVQMPAPYAPTVAEPRVAANTSFYNADEKERALADRVKALEADLKKIHDKEADAKKKAAEAFTVKPFGRLHMDSFFYSQDEISELQYPPGTTSAFLNGFEFRRARIGLQGTGFDVLEYKIEFDFGGQFNTANSETATSYASFKDCYLQVNELPYLGHVRVGHFKEPFGLDQLTSSNYITFMERSLFDEGAFVPGRNSGVMAFDTWADEDGTWAIGGFISENQDKPPVWRHDDSAMALTGRLTYLPWYDEATQGRGLWHTGVAYSYRNAYNDDVNIAVKPESHLAPNLVSLAIPGAPDWHLLGAETAWVYGPLSVQSEYVAAYVNRPALGDAQLYGYYIYVSYFLTGENRPYRKDAGAFYRVKPYENFFRVRAEDGCVYTGKGAWEVAYRWSTIDLNDNGVVGGRYTDNTLGLNWYLTPYSRIMWNYIHSQDSPDQIPVVGALDGSVDEFQMRVQVDF